MERPNPDDDSGSMPDAVPDGDPARKPRDPKTTNPKVTPLDDGKNIEGGIEIKET